MKLSLPALLDAGRRFTAGLGVRSARPRPPASHLARRAVFLAGLTLASAMALHAPGAHAQAWSTERWVGTWGAGPGGPPNDLGYQAMGNTIPLDLFSAVGAAYLKAPATPKAPATH